MAGSESRDESLPRIEVAASRPAARGVLPPPPGLVHLFLFVACCAVYLALTRRVIAAQPSLWGWTLAGLYGLTAATAWAALAILIARTLRGARWPVEPGLYLAAVLGMLLALEELLGLLERPIFQSQAAVVDAVACVALVWPLMGRWPLRWKGVLLGLLLLYSLPIVAGGMSGWLRDARLLVIVVLLALGAWLDWRQGVARSWLHWLGLALWTWSALLNLVFRMVLGT